MTTSPSIDGMTDVQTRVDPFFPDIEHEPQCLTDRMIYGECYHDPETKKRVDPPKSFRLS